MYLKIAWGNVRRCVRDYSVYFVTLAFAVCLLYAFTSAGDYLLALDLTAEQRELYAAAGGVLQAFSVLTMVVFAFLVAYANRFLVRRRKREFALYGLLGMRSGAVSLLLVMESGIVGAGALVAGLAAGVAASPAFGAVAAFVFGVRWQFSLTASAGAAAWTAAGFAGIMVLAAALSARDVRRRSLAELLTAAARPERQRFAGRASLRAQLTLAVALLACVWGTCLLNPGYFLAFILPLGFVALFGTYFLFRVGAARAVRRAQRRPERYLSGLAPVVVRQAAAKVESSTAALACVCVLVAAGVCMMCAGLALSVGMRGAAGMQQAAAALSPVGYVGVLYGLTFLVAAAAILALQQLTEAADNRDAYALLDRLGAEEGECRRAVYQQVGVYFAAPVAMALLHDVFGLALVGAIASLMGSASFCLVAGGTVLVTVALMAAYYALTCRACARTLIVR